MSDGPNINPVLDPKPEPDANLTFQEVMILKQFLEKGTRTEGFFLDVETKSIKYLHAKLENLITAVIKLNEDEKKES